MGKAELKKQQKREALLNTAFQLFIDRGMQKTSISDIVEQAGVAKGTFYLYFKDKTDIRNKLISHKAKELFGKAYREMIKAETVGLEEQILFITDYVLDELNKDKSLLFFLSKHLSWGVFMSAMSETVYDGGKSSQSLADGKGSKETILDSIRGLFVNSGYKFRDPEIMIYMIIELTSGCCYNTILYGEPVSLEEIKPEVFRTIRQIIHNHIVE